MLRNVFLTSKGLAGFAAVPFVSVGRHRQRAGADYAGDQRGQAKVFGCDLQVAILLDWKWRNGKAGRPAVAPLEKGHLQEKRAGTTPPPFLETVLQFERSDQGSANTFSTPESFGMLFHGSPHRSP